MIKIERNLSNSASQSIEIDLLILMNSRQIFLSYHSPDRHAVETVKRFLQARGVQTFMDRENLVPGLPWPQALEEALRGADAMAVFLGPHGLGSWQKREMWFALDLQAREETFPVVPVLLPGADPTPGFLSLNTWVDLRQGISNAEELNALAQAVLGSLPPSTIESRLTICPYRALQAFLEQDAAFFLGREAFSSQLLEVVMSRNWVSVVGPSGSGKSSVVQAGLLPLLRRQRPPAKTWDVGVFSLGNQPFHSLAAALVPLLEPNLPETERLARENQLGDRLEKDEIRLERVIERALELSKGSDRLLLVADQFERLFTRTSTAFKKQSFIEILLTASDQVPLTVVLTLRADFYGQLIGLSRDLSDRMVPGLVNLGPMTRAELSRAITGPARLVGLDFDSGLVERILDDLGTEPGNLPLLEFALTQLWEQRQEGLLTHDAYERIGGVEKAIADRAEKEFNSFSSERQEVARRLFTRMVRIASPEEGGDDTSQHAVLTELGTEARPVVLALADARLLVTGREQIGSIDEETVELAHEALIHHWNRLSKWLKQDREFLLWRQRLQAALRQWEIGGRDEDDVLRGSFLEEADRWLHQRQEEFTLEEQALIFYSLALREHTSGKLGQAQEYYRHAIEVAPDFAEVHYNLHLIHIQEDELDRALDEYELALRLNAELAIVPGGYQVNQILSASGPSIVYKALDEEQKPVVVKVLKQGYVNEEVIEILKSVADRRDKALHPDILRVIDFSRRGKRIYLLREYTPGQSLDDFMDEKPMSAKDAWKILARVGFILDEIHHRGFIHGNLKPTNIFIDGDRILLADEGVAGIAKAEGYFLPEQGQGLEQPQTDVHTLATVLQEMLIRRAGNEIALPSSVDASLALVIEIARSPKPENRYSSVDDFLHELSRVSPLQITYAKQKWPFRLAAIGAQQLRIVIRRGWRWLLVLPLTLGLLAPLLFPEAYPLRQALRIASILLALTFILAPLTDRISLEFARRFRSASISASGAISGVLLAISIGQVWLKSLEFRIPEPPPSTIPCDPRYVQAFGLGRVSTLRFFMEVLLIDLIGSLLLAGIVFGTTWAAAALFNRFERKFSTGYFLMLFVWILILFLIGLRVPIGWFGCV